MEKMGDDSTNIPQPGSDLDAWALERLEDMLEKTAQEGSDVSISDILEENIDMIADVNYDLVGNILGKENGDTFGHTVVISKDGTTMAIAAYNYVRVFRQRRNTGSSTSSTFSARDRRFAIGGGERSRCTTKYRRRVGGR